MPGDVQEVHTVAEGIQLVRAFKSTHPKGPEGSLCDGDFGIGHGHGGEGSVMGRRNR
jgi:hypothetical protein